jgi:hypothetical protein
LREAARERERGERRKRERERRLIVIQKNTEIKRVKYIQRFKYVGQVFGVMAVFYPLPSLSINILMA